MIQGTPVEFVIKLIDALWMALSFIETRHRGAEAQEVCRQIREALQVVGQEKQRKGKKEIAK